MVVGFDATTTEKLAVLRALAAERDATNLAIAALCEELLDDHPVTQAEVARCVGVHRSTISRTACRT